MLRLTIADLRESWTAWLGVSLTFIATNFAVCLAALCRQSAVFTGAHGGMTQQQVDDFTPMAMFNIALCALTTLTVVSASTALVINSRRGSIARLALAGAAPGQIVRLLVAQIALASLACAVIGDVIAMATLRPTLSFISTTRGLPAMSAHIDPGWMIGVNVGVALVSVIGGFTQARAASGIPPVEALREASGLEGYHSRVRTARWVFVVVLAAATVVAFVGLSQAVKKVPGIDPMSSTIQVAMLMMPLSGVVLAMAAPLTIGVVTRFWTALLPIPDATWLLARNTVVAKSQRLTRTVVPVMFAIGMTFGMMGLSDTFLASLHASGHGEDFESTSLSALLLLIGLPIIISIASSVGGLIMMSRQRSAEVALDGVIGATPAQQVVIPMLEAVIITVTGVILGLVMACISIFYLMHELPHYLPHVAWSLPLGVLAGIGGISVAVAIAATTLPTLPTLRRPAPSVIARLVAA